jgi:hypothetical protein
MIRQCGVAGLAIFLFAGAAKGGETVWKEYTWTKGKCMLLLPAPPKEDTQKKTAPDKSVIEVFSWTVQQPNVGYIITVVVHPAFLGANDEEKQRLLKQGSAAAVKNLKGKLLEEKPIQLTNHPGLEIQVEFGGGLFRARTYFVDDRMYTIAVSGLRDMVVSKDADRFLDSFKLAK